MAILHTDYLGAHVTQWPPFSSSMHNSLDSFKCNKKKIQNKSSECSSSSLFLLKLRRCLCTVSFHVL